MQGVHQGLWDNVRRVAADSSPEVAAQQRIQSIRSYLVDGTASQMLMLPSMALSGALELVRRSSDEDLLVLKGLQIAALYPQTWMRDTGDDRTGQVVPGSHS
jgi:hypothetical protein